MSKLYRGVDKSDGRESCFLVNDMGVAISSHCGDNEEEIQINKESEHSFEYESAGEFAERAINPVLIEEW